MPVSAAAVMTVCVPAAVFRYMLTIGPSEKPRTPVSAKTSRMPQALFLNLLIAKSRPKATMSGKKPMYWTSSAMATPAIAALKSRVMDNSM